MFKSFVLIFGLLLTVVSVSQAGVNVRDHGAKGDGQTDDTVAIRRAFAQAAKNARGGRVPRSDYFLTTPEVYFPSGHYIISDAIDPSADTIRGEGHAVIEQKTANKEIFRSQSATRRTFLGLHFIGGQTHLSLGNPNVDKGFLVMENCNFQMSNGPAVVIQEGTNSTFTIIRNCEFINCNRVLTSYCDWTLMKSCWIGGGHEQNNVAMIEHRGDKMVLEDIVGVENANGVDQRWIDNYGAHLTCRDFRFGGDVGGFTPIVNFARYTEIGTPRTIVIEDSRLYNSNNLKRPGAIHCEEVPNLIEIRSCYLGGLPAVSTRQDLDLEHYFTNVAPERLAFDVVNCIGQTSLPPLLAKPVIIQFEKPPPVRLSDDEVQAAFAAVSKTQLADPPEVADGPAESAGHRQQLDPADFVEVRFDKLQWHIDSDALALAPLGDDIILLRRIGALDISSPSLTIRNVSVDLDSHPYITWKFRDPGPQKNTAAHAHGIWVIDKEEQAKVNVAWIAISDLNYQAFNLKEKLARAGITGKRTLEIIMVHFATHYYAPPTADDRGVTFTEAGGYSILDFIRFEKP